MAAGILGFICRDEFGNGPSYNKMEGAEVGSDSQQQQQPRKLDEEGVGYTSASV